MYRLKKKKNLENRIQVLEQYLAHSDVIVVSIL